MRNSLPIRLFFIFSLLFAQQAGAAHAVHHALEDLTQQQHDKKSPHSDACGKCAAYAQLGNALSVAVFDLPPPVAIGQPTQFQIAAFRSTPILAADARAPPYS